MNKKRPRWKKPKLTLLISNNRQESVFTGCKYTGDWAMSAIPGPGYSACHSEDWAGTPCHANSNS
jgi:hypothetical protein